MSNLTTTPLRLLNKDVHDPHSDRVGGQPLCFLLHSTIPIIHKTKLKNLAIFVVHFMDFVWPGQNHESIFSQNAAQIRLVFALHWSIWPSTH